MSGRVGADRDMNFHCDHLPNRHRDGGFTHKKGRARHWFCLPRLTFSQKSRIAVNRDGGQFWGQGDGDGEGAAVGRGGAIIHRDDFKVVAFLASLKWVGAGLEMIVQWGWKLRRPPTAPAPPARARARRSPPRSGAENRYED